MSKLHLLSRVLNLLDFILHFVEISIQLFFVLLVAYLYLLQAFAEFVFFPLDLHVLIHGVVELHAHTPGESIDNSLNFGEAYFNSIHFHIVHVGRKLRCKAHL